MSQINVHCVRPLKHYNEIKLYFYFFLEMTSSYGGKIGVWHPIIWSPILFILVIMQFVGWYYVIGPYLLVCVLPTTDLYNMQKWRSRLKEQKIANIAVANCVYCSLSNLQNSPFCWQQWQRHCPINFYSLVVGWDSSSFERVEEFRYLGTTLTDKNSVQEEIKSRLKSGSACYHSVQSLFFQFAIQKFTD
jgi:hypothetical protein